MDKLIGQLSASLPKLVFTAGKKFSWSPGSNQIYYVKSDSPEAIWSILHETGHYLLHHNGYFSDIDLLKKEVQAWQKAEALAKDYGIEIAPSYIEKCLDSYRDWLYERSICPRCATVSSQLDEKAIYRCHNCGQTWRVSASKFCRVYREIAAIKKPPLKQLV